MDNYRSESTASWLTKATERKPEIGCLDVAGTDIHYEVWDGPDRSTGILLVHGMQAHTRWWDPIAPYLAEDHRVAAFDFSGMGESGHRDEYDSLVHADELRAVACATGVAGGIVIAHSYGATPALLACLDTPELFGRIVILDSRICLPGSDPVLGSGPHVPWEKKIYPAFEAALSRFRLTPPGPLADPDVLAHIARHSLHQTEEGWTWKFDSRLLRRIDLNRELDPTDLKVPVSYIRGECSNVSTPQRMALNYRYFPDADYLKMPAAGHHLMIDQPLALVAMLRGLLGAQHFSRDARPSLPEA